MALSPSKLAIRFIGMRRGRSALTALGVALGVALLASLLTLSSTMDRNLDIQLRERYGSFNMLVGYRDPSMWVTPEQLSTIKHTPGVVDAATSLQPYRKPVEQTGLIYQGVEMHRLNLETMKLSNGRMPGAGEVVLSDLEAKKRDLKLGDTLELPFGASMQTVTLVGIYPHPTHYAVSAALFEVEWLREVTGRPGYDQVRLDLAEDVEPARVRMELEKRIPGLEILTRTKVEEQKKRLNALRPVAKALGFSALFAAGFLVTGAFQMSVQERIREMAILRANGASRGQIFLLVTSEAALLGGVGAAVGLLIGVGLAWVSMGVTGKFLSVTVSTLVVPWRSLLLVGLGGIVLAVIFAIPPAWSAASTPPALAMRTHGGAAEESRLRAWSWLGVAVFLLGSLLMASNHVIPRKTETVDLLATLGSVGGLLVLIGVILGLPRLLGLLVPVLSYPLRSLWRTESLLAIRFLLRHRRRSAVTTGALALGLVLLVGVNSFTTALSRSGEQQVRAEHPSDGVLMVPYFYGVYARPQLLEQVRATPGVTAVGVLGSARYGILTNYDWSRADQAFVEWTKAHNETPGKLYFGVADLFGLQQTGALKVVEGTLTADGAVIGKRYRDHYGMQVGDDLELGLLDSNGIVERVIRTKVTAVVDGVKDLYPLMMPLDSLGSITGVRAIYFNGSADAKVRIKTILDNDPQYDVVTFSDADIATATFRDFMRQRMMIVYAVVGVVGVIALFSLTSTLLTNLQERRRELAVMQAVGADSRKLVRMVMSEAMILSMAGGVVGSATGAIMGRSLLSLLEFGEVPIPWMTIVLGVSASLALGVISGVIPALLTRKISVAQALLAE
jgi:putative ABC transport system permease protein